MRTKQFILSILALGMAGLLAACSDEDGKWDSMKWKTGVKTVKDAKGSYVSVPKEGGTYTFTSKNYPGFWFSDAMESQDGQIQSYYPDKGNTYYHMTTSWAQMDREGKDLIVRIQPNTGTSGRTLTVSVTAGDIFDSFRFVQSSGQP